MSYAGIDFDTHAVHIVLLWDDQKTSEYFRIELSGEDAFDRTRSLVKTMPNREWWKIVGVEAIGIEEPQGAQRATVAKLKAVQGAILMFLPSELLVTPLVPARWKTEVGLHGNASKEEIMAFVKARWKDGVKARSLEDVGQDECDAYCIALATSRLVVPA